jgi:hypothetical protein
VDGGGPDGSIQPSSSADSRKSPVERLGGLLAVAAHVLYSNDKGRGQKIVEDVERELASTNRQH